MFQGRVNASDGAAALPDIRSVQPDLAVPEISLLPPGAGSRVRRTLPACEQTDVHHTLYLPVDWHPGKRYPI